MKHGKLKPTLTLRQPQAREWVVQWHKVNSLDDVVRIMRAMRFRFHGEGAHLVPIMHMLRELRPGETEEQELMQ